MRAFCHSIIEISQFELKPVSPIMNHNLSLGLILPGHLWTFEHSWDVILVYMLKQSFLFVLNVICSLKV